MIGSQDVIVGLVIVVVLFGARKLPELAGSIGKSLKEFKKGMAEATEDTPPSTPAAAAKPLEPPATRTCPSCQTALQPDWQHCPRCGAASS